MTVLTTDIDVSTVAMNRVSDHSKTDVGLVLLEGHPVRDRQTGWLRDHDQPVGPLTVVAKSRRAFRMSIERFAKRAGRISKERLR